MPVMLLSPDAAPGELPAEKGGQVPSSGALTLKRAAKHGFFLCLCGPNLPHGSCGGRFGEASARSLRSL
jgi:hypothetical protein